MSIIYSLIIFCFYDSKTDNFCMKFPFSQPTFCENWFTVIYGINL